MAANYKVRALRAYASIQKLESGEMRYRRVFDASDSTAIRFELSLFNKKFDEEEWSLKWELRLVDPWGEPMTTLVDTRTVSKDSLIGFARVAVEPKRPWCEGAYRYEAWIQGHKVAEEVLYFVDDIGPQAGYLEPLRVGFYEGPQRGVVEDQRLYLAQFDAKSMRYAWVEQHLTLKKRDTRWPLELVVRVFFETGELKSELPSLKFVEPNTETYAALVGLGTDTPGHWHPGTYRVETMFMERVLWSTSVIVGDRAIPLEHMTSLAGRTETTETIDAQVAAPATTTTSPPPTETIEDVLKELDDFIGLTRFKEQLRATADYQRFVRLRAKHGLTEDSRPGLHVVFRGGPGTGKTTAARLLARAYRALGLVSKGHLVEVGRVELVGKYVGQTAPATKAQIDSARGGVLFIDEAYALARPETDSNDFGREVIEVLLKEMSDGPGDIAIVCAGYPQEMDTFLESNPGLGSRFAMTFEFPDFTPTELVAIADRGARKRAVSFAPAARDQLERVLFEKYRTRDRSFGNARAAYGLVDSAKMNLARRLMAHVDPGELTESELTTIELVDLGGAATPQPRVVLPIDDRLLAEVLGELDGLIGLESVKREVKDVCALARFYRESGRPLSNLSLHQVFTGNPGTGKTTIARIIARLYKALGLLERGHVVECDREGLVAGFAGQTALKAAARIDEAIGGVLFIDEAYSLVRTDRENPGIEALEVILKRMEDRRGEFVVIVAGYTGPMQDFLESNPGLRSRFDRIFEFPDYSAGELFAVAASLFAREQLVPTPEVEAELQRVLAQLCRDRDDSFGNAREVRRLVTRIVHRHDVRLAALAIAERTPELLRGVLPVDLEGVMPEPTRAPRIGFGNG